MRKMIQGCTKHDKRGPHKGFLWLSKVFNIQGYNSVFEKRVRQQSMTKATASLVLVLCVIFQSRDSNQTPLHHLWSLQVQLIFLTALSLREFLYPGAWSHIAQGSLVENDYVAKSFLKHLLLPLKHLLLQKLEFLTSGITG